jgi:DNA polymerase zeta
MKVMSLEVHSKIEIQVNNRICVYSNRPSVNTREKLVPDPERDQIDCIFWCIRSTEDGEDDEIRTVLESIYLLSLLAFAHLLRFRTGILAITDEEADPALKFRRQCQAEVQIEYSELDLINSLVDIVRELDPDILTGWEVHSSSWGYIIERARAVFGTSFPWILMQWSS